VKRALRSRATSALALAPVTVSDLTAPAVFGFADGRPFREFLVREHVAHARVGHRVFARVEDVADALARVARTTAEQGEETREGGDESSTPDTVEGVLRVLGKRRTA
jgi:hypothetical protein